MRNRNRERENAAWRNWYRKNAARKHEWQKQRRDEVRQWWQQLKATKQCERCDERAPECLHFHHRDPSEKDFDLGQAASAGMSRERILAEVAKCEVLCANCHLKLHWDVRML